LSGDPQFTSVRRRQRPDAAKGPNSDTNWGRTGWDGDDPFRRQPARSVPRQVPPGSVTSQRSSLPSHIHLQLLNKTDPAPQHSQKNLLPQPLQDNDPEQRAPVETEQQEEHQRRQHLAVLLQQLQQEHVEADQRVQQQRPAEAAQRAGVPPRQSALLLDEAPPVHSPLHPQARRQLLQQAVPVRLPETSAAAAERVAPLQQPQLQDHTEQERSQDIVDIHHQRQCRQV
jgi:hypothetical protein